MNTGRDVFSVNHITFPATVGYGTFFLAFLLVPAGR